VACGVSVAMMSRDSKLESESAAADIVAGFFSFTEITDPSAHVAYNEWHQLDHLPEQMPIPGIAHGQRWVASPRCVATRDHADEDLALAHYITLYLMRPPLEDTLRDFYELARVLHMEDRFFAYRRAIESGPVAVTGAYASPRVRVSAAAVPYRPNRGVYVIVDHPDVDSSVDPGAIDELLRVDGVAGVWRFRNAPSAVEVVVAPSGTGKTLSGDVTVCYLDQDPFIAGTAVRNLLSPFWKRRGSEPRFAGVFETVVPWKWDWFENENGSDRSNDR
jgi:hypothetical protein